MPKIKDTLLKFLKQGTSPEKLALTLALGIVIGAFPVIGPTTLLCTFAAFLFRVNLAAIQFVNYISYPIQIICIIPFYKLGAILFRDNSFKLTFSELKHKVTTDFYGTLAELWDATWHALTVWAMIAPLAALVIYLIAYPLIKKISKKNQKISNSPF